MSFDNEENHALRCEKLKVPPRGNENVTFPR